MRVRGIPLVACVLLLGSAVPMAEATQAESDAFIAAAQDVLPRVMRRYEVPSTAIAVTDGRNVVWTRSRGTPEGKDVFEVASLTKTVTALAVLSLVERKKVDLDKPVNDYLTRWKVRSRKFDASGVTARRLLSHTAGLPFGYPKDERPAEYPRLEDILDGEAGMPGPTIEKEPGSAFTYSNPGYAVLELLIEEVTGKGYTEAVRTLVLEPLEMKDSGFQDDPALAARVVRGHRKAGDPAERLLRYPRAAGGMLSTAHDVGRLLIGTSFPKDKGGLLEEASLSEMRRLDGPSRGAFGLSDGGYALGVARAALPSGRIFVANYGSHESYNALMLSIPDKGIGFTLLTNSATGSGAELELALLFFKTIAGESPSFASRIETFRRGLQIAAIVALALCLFLLLRVALAVRTGRRSWPGRLVTGRLVLRTIPLAVLATVIFLTSNTSAVTSMIAPIPPARFVSTTHEYVTAAIAVALALIALAATALPRSAEEHVGSTSMASRSSATDA